MSYAGRNNIYEAAINRMVKEALEIGEREFSEAHSGDTDEQLLVYLCQCAARLGHTPWPGEITGGSLIVQRFGDWNTALLKAKLPRPCTPDNLTGFARIQEERARQEIAYRQKKAAKKLRAQQRQAQQEKQKR